MSKVDRLELLDLTRLTVEQRNVLQGKVRTQKGVLSILMHAYQGEKPKHMPSRPSYPENRDRVIDEALKHNQALVVFEESHGLEGIPQRIGTDKTGTLYTVSTEYGNLFLKT